MRETNPLPSRPRAVAVTSKIFLAVAIIVIGAILVAGGAMVVAATGPPSRASSAGSAVAADVVTLLATNADGCHYSSKELCAFVVLGLPRI